MFIATSALNDTQWVPCLDTQGAVPFAIREVFGSEIKNSVLVLTTRDPQDDTLGKMYVITGPETIAALSYGRCTFATEYPSYAKYDTSDTGDPAFNDELGPKAAQSTLDIEGFGFTCLAAGDSSTGLVWCIQQPRPQATIILAAINEGSDVATTDPNFAIDTVTILSPQNAVLRDVPTNANNPFDMAGDDDGKVVCVWNDVATGTGDTDNTYNWTCIQMACPA